MGAVMLWPRVGWTDLCSSVCICGFRLARVLRTFLWATKPMKTLLRDMATRRYFQSEARWTSDRDDAFDFGVLSKAVKIAQKLRIPDLEVVLSVDNPEQVIDTPFAKFLRELSQPRSQRLANSRV